jgi:uncharacterized C2H2 Zn-finger protein
VKSVCLNCEEVTEVILLTEDGETFMKCTQCGKAFEIPKEVTCENSCNR